MTSVIMAVPRQFQGHEGEVTGFVPRDASRPQLAALRPPVEVLGVDETRRGKPIWAPDPVPCRW